MPSDEGAECGYCGGTDLAYELRSDKGPVERCIPCLAIEQGQQQFSMPFEEFIDNSKHEDSVVFDDAEQWREHREIAYVTARDWFKVLARINDDEPLVKRDPDAIGTINEHTREFLTNIMGSDAHHPPSEIVGSEVDVAETVLGGGSDE